MKNAVSTKLIGVFVVLFTLSGFLPSLAASHTIQGPVGETLSQAHGESILVGSRHSSRGRSFRHGKQHRSDRSFRHRGFSRHGFSRHGFSRNKFRNSFFKGGGRSHKYRGGFRHGRSFRSFGRQH